MKYINLIKFKHFFKNIIIFIPLILSFNHLSILSLNKNIAILFLANFIALCFVSQFVYMFNDYCDKNRDIGVKKNLFNSFKGKKNTYYLVALVFLLFPYMILSKNQIFYNTMQLITLYLIMNILYSLVLKKKFYFGLIFLSFFFVIRLCIGIKILNYKITDFLLQILIIFFGALYIGVAKRYKYIKTNSDLFNQKEKVIRKIFKNLFIIVNVFMLYFLFSNQNLKSTFLDQNLIIYKKILLSIFFIYGITIFRNKVKNNSKCADFINIILERKILIIAIFFIVVYIL